MCIRDRDYKIGLDKLVSDSAATALYKVFVEHHQKDKDGNTIPHEDGKSDWRQELDEKCWPGYEKKGMKTMFGKRYPNCVKKSKKKK